MTVDEALGAARKLHLAGALDAAQVQYRRVLRLAPNHPDALTMLASIAYRTGDDPAGGALADAAIAAYRRMLLTIPDNHVLRAALSNLLVARDRVSEAETVIAKAVLPFNPIRASQVEFDARRRSARKHRLPGVLINALPKSASESIWNKLSEGLGLAQGHISLGLFPDCLTIPHRVRELGLGGMAAKEHLSATRYNLSTLAEAGVDRIVVHIRDPRQATLSWAHFLEDDVKKRLLAPLWRKTTPPARVFAAPFGTQLDWHIDHYLPVAVRFVADWLEARDSRPGGVTVKPMTFEAFKTDPGAYFEAVLEFYKIDRTLYASDVEAEVVHLRKGTVDEWRGVFTPEQSARAWRQIPVAMAEEFDWRP